MRMWTVILVCGFAFPVLGASCAPVDELTLDDGAISLSFASPEQGFGCSGIVNKAAGGQRFVRMRKNDITLWELLVSKRDERGSNVVERLNNRTARCVAKTFSRSGDSLKLHFDGIEVCGEKDAFDIVASIRLDPAVPGRSEWRIGVRAKGRTWAPTEVRYPYLSDIADEGVADVLVPAMGQGARLIRKYDTKGKSQFYDYPGGFPMMAAYMIGEAGLYFGAHDPDEKAKGVCCRRFQNFSFTRYAENSGVVGQAETSQLYPVVIQTFSGDWYEAAKIYRAWAVKQKWCRKGPKATRKDYPKRMAELGASFVLEEDPSIVSNFVPRIARDGWERFGRIAMWTKWSYLPHDAGYPDTRPPRKFMPETAKWAGERMGVEMMPYMNPRLWAYDSAGFRYAKKDAVRKADGGFWIERYSKRRLPFAVMCPFAKDWQDTLVKTVLDTVRETNVGAVYLDQITLAGQRSCYDPAHGHALGGGSWWVDGYRGILTRIHDELAPRNIPIASEEGGDSWEDCIDGHYLAAPAAKDEVPFFPVVYSAYSTYFGTSIQPFELEFEKFFPIVADHVVHGVVNGCGNMGSGYRLIGQARHSDAVRRGAEFRIANRDFLCYGFIEGAAPAPEGVKAVRWTDVTRRRAAVVAANLTDETKTLAAFGKSHVLEPYAFNIIEN